MKQLAKMPEKRRVGYMGTYPGVSMPYSAELGHRRNASYYIQRKKCKS